MPIGEADRHTVTIRSLLGPLRGRDQALRRLRRRRGRRPDAGGARRRDLRPRRPLGLRQDDGDADGQPHGRDDRGRHPDRRRVGPRRASRPRLRREIGYVIQQIGLFPHRTIAENIGAVPQLLGWKKERTPRPATAELLELIGLDPELGEPLPGAALRRPAAARRRRPGARRRPAGDADGRALRRDRPDQPRAPAERVPAPAGGDPARPSSSSPTTSTRRSRWATGSRSCARAARSPSTRPRPSC